MYSERDRMYSYRSYSNIIINVFKYENDLLEEVRLNKSTIIEADYANCEIVKNYIYSADFEIFSLDKTIMKNTDINLSKFDDVDILNSSIIGCNIVNTKFSDGYIYGGSAFEECRLTKTTFTNIVFEDTCFHKCKLENVVFRDCVFKGKDSVILKSTINSFKSCSKASITFDGCSFNGRTTSRDFPAYVGGKPSPCIEFVSSGGELKILNSKLSDGLNTTGWEGTTRIDFEGAKKDTPKTTYEEDDDYDYYAAYGGIYGGVYDSYSYNRSNSSVVENKNYTHNKYPVLFVSNNIKTKGKMYG